jgi:hypothetical protein
MSKSYADDEDVGEKVAGAGLGSAAPGAFFGGRTQKHQSTCPVGRLGKSPKHLILKKNNLKKIYGLQSISDQQTRCAPIVRLDRWSAGECSYRLGLRSMSAAREEIFSQCPKGLTGHAERGMSVAGADPC